MKNTLADGFYAAFDLGSHSVKVVLVDCRNGKEHLAAIEEELLKPPADFPGENEFRDHQIQRVKQLIERLPLHDIREWVAVLNSRELQVKLVELPSQVQPEKLPEVLRWEAKKLLSPTYRNEPFLVAHRILRESPPAAIVAVIPQSILARVHEFFLAAGIELSGAYADVFGCLSLKEGIETTGMPALSIINLGHTGTHLQIFSAGELKFYRFIPSGCSEFSNPPISSELDTFSQKIRFSFDYFRAVTKLGHIDELLFMGGGAALPEYISFAREYFAPGKIDALDVSQKIDISPVLPQVNELPGPTIRHARLMPFLPALGAYWAHRDPGADDCNLLGRYQSLLWKERMNKFSNTLPIWVAIAGLLILAVSLGLWRISMLDQLEQSSQKASIASNDLTTTQVKITKLQKARIPEILLSSRDKSAISELLRDRLGSDEVLFLIDQKKTDGVKLHRIQIQAKSQADDETPEEETEAGSLESEIGSRMSGSSDPSPAPAPGPGPDSASDPDPDPDPGPGPNSQVEPAPRASAMPSPTPMPSGAGNPGSAMTQNIEDLGGEMLVLKGTATGYEPLASFAEDLVKVRVIRRYRIIEALGKRSELRFILKGEMP